MSISDHSTVNGGAKPKRDWPAIRLEYQSTAISQRQLAAKHGIAIGTLEKRARREGWFQAGKVVSKRARELDVTIQKKAQALVDSELAPFIEAKKREITKLGYQTAAKGLRRINKLFAANPPTDAKAEADAARATESNVRTGRTCLGMSDGTSAVQPLTLNLLATHSAIKIESGNAPNEQR